MDTDVVSPSTNHMRKIVETYLSAFESDELDFKKLESILDSSLKVTSPLGVFASRAEYLDDLKRDRLRHGYIKQHWVLCDENRVCALYDWISRDAHLKTLLCTEWFEIKNSKITSIVSTFDASQIKELRSRI